MKPRYGEFSGNPDVGYGEWIFICHFEKMDLWLKKASVSAVRKDTHYTIVRVLNAQGFYRYLEFEYKLQFPFGDRDVHAEIRSIYQGAWSIYLDNQDPSISPNAKASC